MRVMKSKERRCDGVVEVSVGNQRSRGGIAVEGQRCCSGAARARGEGREHRLIVATRFWDRLRGFLVPRPLACVLLISPCSSIHTFGMKAALDVAFFDKEGTVLCSELSVEPGKVIRCKGAVGVLEQMSDDRDGWYRKGEEVVLYV